MKAWVTLLTHSLYMPGLLALGRSLKKVGSQYPLIVMVTDTVEAELRNQLIAEGYLLQDVERLDPKLDLVSHYLLSRYSEVWTKLRVWEMETLERAILLDADMLVLKNMDELFDIELPENGIAACHACKCNYHKMSKYPPNWIPENCFFTRSETAGEAKFGIAEPDDYFNAGLIVLQPNKRALEEIVDRIEAIDPSRNLPFPEQDILNDHFQGQWRTLPYTYNGLKQLSFGHPRTWNINDIKNLHYTLKKPWEVKPGEVDEYEELNKLWWEVYNTQTQSAISVQ
jgi:alpha-N-acetylglucosamine transferase